MAYVMISFEFENEQYSSQELDRHLHTLGNPCHVFSNLRVIETDKKQADVFDSLKDKIFKGNDRFVVATLTEPWEAYNCKASGPCYE